MKKALILLLALGMVGMSAFAEDGKVEFAVSGSASLTFGMDLDTTTFGWKNEASSDLTVTLVNAADKTKGTDADGAAYATITLSGLKVSFNQSTGTLIDPALTTTVARYWFDANSNGAVDDGEIKGVQPVIVSAPGVAAKLMFKPMYMTIYGKPGLGLNYAGKILDATEFSGDMSLGDGFGTTIGYDGGDIAVSAFCASAADWNTGAQDFATGLDATLKFAPVTVGLGARANFGATTWMSFAAKAALALDPISFDVAFDGISAATFDWDMRANASMKFMTASSFGVGFFMSSAAANSGELKASFALGAADAGGFSAGANFFMLHSFADMMFDVSVGYVTGNITIGAKFRYNESSDGGAYALNSMYAGLNVAVANIVPNATLTIDWTSGDLGAATAVLGDITVKIGVAF